MKYKTIKDVIATLEAQNRFDDSYLLLAFLYNLGFSEDDIIKLTGGKRGACRVAIKFLRENGWIDDELRKDMRRRIYEGGRDKLPFVIREKEMIKFYDHEKFLVYNDKVYVYLNKKEVKNIINLLKSIVKLLKMSESLSPHIRDVFDKLDRLEEIRGEVKEKSL